MTLKLAAIVLLGLTNPRDAAVEPATEAAQMDHSGMGEVDSGSMMDLGPAAESFDLRFIDAMIMHHQGAVVMAEDAQQNSARPEIQTLASEIIAARQSEIAEMQAWRQAWKTVLPAKVRKGIRIRAGWQF